MTKEKDLLAENVVTHMMENDLFSQWLGIEVLEIKEGYSKIKMTALLLLPAITGIICLWRWTRLSIL
jgi:hypothetical protein